MDKTAQLF